MVPEATRPSRIRRLYDWTVRWAGHRRAAWALFAIAFAESSFFPIPPDVLLIAMCFAGPTRSFAYAAVCGVGSVAGGVFGYWIGSVCWTAAAGFFYCWVPGFTQARFDGVCRLYQDNAFWTVFAAAFTPIPYKVFTIAGGACGIPLSALLLGSVAGRFGRFFLVAGFIFFAGERLRGFIERYFEWVTVAFAALLIGGFVVVKLFI